MPRPLVASESAREAQVILRDARRRCTPMLEAALASGDWTTMADAKAFATTFRALLAQARLITGRLDAVACADHIARPAHGRAA